MHGPEESFNCNYDVSSVETGYIWSRALCFSSHGFTEDSEQREMAQSLIKVSKWSFQSFFSLKITTLFYYYYFISKSAIQSCMLLRGRDKARTEMPLVGQKGLFCFSSNGAAAPINNFPEQQAWSVNTILYGDSGTECVIAEMCALRCGEWINPV